MQQRRKWALGGLLVCLWAGGLVLAFLLSLRTPTRAVPEGIRWERLYSTPLSHYDQPTVVVGQGSDQVIVVGSRYNGLDDDIAIRCLSLETGASLWEQTFSGETRDESWADDTPAGAVLSADGLSLYVVGLTNQGIAQGPTGPAGQDTDALLMKLDARDGSVLWTKTFDAGRQHPESQPLVTLDRDDRPVIAFADYELSSTRKQYHVIGLQSVDGLERWSSREELGGDSGGFPIQLQTSPNGGIVVTGWASVKAIVDIHSYAAELDPDSGDKRWEYLRTALSWPTDSVIHRDGSITVMHTEMSPYRTQVERLDPTGGSIWDTRFHSGFADSDSPRGLQVDDRGDVYGFVRTTDSHHIGSAVGLIVVKLDGETGEEVWRSLYELAEGGSGSIPHFFSHQIEPKQLILDSNHDPIVFGTAGNGRDLDMFAVRFDREDGRITPLTTYDGPVGGHDHFAAAVITGNYRTVMIGRSCNVSPALKRVKSAGYRLIGKDSGAAPWDDSGRFDQEDPYLYDLNVIRLY